MGLLLLAIVCGVLGALVRNTKGEPVVGFFAGLFLGPLGVILAAAWPADARGPAGTKQCPDCAEWVKVDANVCKHCGYRGARAPVDPV